MSVRQGGGKDARLSRSLGAWGAGAFVVTNMVGAGIFTVPAFVRVATGSAIGALLVWLAGAGVALCGALCYAELACRMPRAGGEYHYLSRVYGRVWGFLSGWVSFAVGFSAALAAAALGAVAYTATLLPGWDPAAPLVEGGGSGRLGIFGDVLLANGLARLGQGAVAAAALILLVAGLHALGLRIGGRAQALLAGSVVVGIGAFVLLAIASGRGSWAWLTAPAAAGPAGLAEAGRSAGAATVGGSTGVSAAAAAEGGTPGLLGGWWIAFLQVTFAYSGWNAAAYLAEEVRAPRRNLPRALVGGTLVVALLYLALNAVFFYALPAGGWGAELAVGKAAATTLFGPGAAVAISGLVALAIVGSVSAMTAAGPRVYWAMARDGVAPRGWLELTGAGAPARAIWAQGFVAATMALTGAFDALLVYIGSALLLFSGLAVGAVVVLRRRHGPPDGYRAPLYPLAPAAFLTVVVVALANGVLQRPGPTLAAGATVLAGAGAFGMLRRRFPPLLEVAGEEA